MGGYRGVAAPSRQPGCAGLRNPRAGGARAPTLLAWGGSGVSRSLRRRVVVALTAGGCGLGTTGGRQDPARVTVDGSTSARPSADRPRRRRHPSRALRPAPSGSPASAPGCGSRCRRTGRSSTSPSVLESGDQEALAGIAKQMNLPRQPDARRRPAPSTSPCSGRRAAASPRTSTSRPCPSRRCPPRPSCGRCWG